MCTGKERKWGDGRVEATVTVWSNFSVRNVCVRLFGFIHSMREEIMNNYNLFIWWAAFACPYMDILFLSSERNWTIPVTFDLRGGVVNLIKQAERCDNVIDTCTMHAVLYSCSSQLLPLLYTGSSFWLKCQQVYRSYLTK